MGTPAKINLDGVELRVSRDGYLSGIAEKLYNALDHIFEVSVNNNGRFKGYVTIYKANFLNAFISANRFEVRLDDDIGYSFEYVINSKELTIKATQGDKIIFMGDIADFIVAHSTLLDKPELYFIDERTGCYYKQKELFSKDSYKKVLNAHKEAAAYFKEGNPNKSEELKKMMIMKEAKDFFIKEMQNA